MRVATDTNVLVSAALNPVGTPARVVEIVAVGGTFLESADTVAELNRVIRRPKFDRFRPLAERLLTLAAVAGVAERVAITERVAACRDPDDDKFLEVAVNGSATHLVTGDADLLALHPYRGIAILTPADFVALFDPPARP